MINRKALFYSLGINIFFLMLCLVFGNLRFGANDDCFMAGILTGAYGDEYNVHLTFVNALYGYCLLPLYHLIPSIQWYYIGEIFSIFISLFVASYIIIRKIGEKWGIIFATLLVALCANDYYIVVQFTQCAAMLSAVGMLCFIYGLEKWNDSQKKSMMIIVLGILLMWWGSWMRWAAFLMGMPIFAGILLLHVKKFWQIKSVVLITLLIMFSGAFGFQKFNQSLYQSPDYKKYMDFQGPRSLLGDGQNYNQQAVYEDLEEMGYSGKDYATLIEWTFYDPDVFAPESIRVVTDVIGRYFFKHNTQVLPSVIMRALSKSICRPIFIAWFLFSLALFIFNPKKSLWTWVSLTIVIALIAHLLNLQRLVYRVETGLWLYATVLTVPLLKERFYIPRNISIGIVVTIALLNLFSYATTGTQFRSPNGGELVIPETQFVDTTDRKGFWTYVNSAPDSVVFLIEMNTYSGLIEKKNIPYLTDAKGSWEHLVSFGYWTPYFPDVENSLRKRGITNPMKDVVKENVLVVDEPTLVDYLERHYYKKVKVDTVRDFKGLTIYKYSLVTEIDAEEDQ